MCLFRCGCHLLLGRRRACMAVGGMCLHGSRFRWCWQGDVLAPAPGAGDRRTSLHSSSSLSTAEWDKKGSFDEKTGSVWPKTEPSARAKFTREYVLRQFWLSFFWKTSSIWEGEQENWVGPRSAGSIWIYKKSVVCNGQLQDLQTEVYDASCQLGVCRRS